MAGPIRISILANASKAISELNRTNAAMTGISGAGARMAKGIAIGVAGGAVALGAFAVKGVKAASDLNETINKSNTIFGKNAESIEKWASGGAKSMGLSKVAALDAAAGFGDMFSQIGFTGQAAARLSKSTVQMAADFGSFNNLPTADVAERISAAYRGEYDSLQALVPNINAARVEQEAMTKTGKDSAKELTARDKALAVNAILTKDGARAMGDFARTSEGAANKQKILAAQFDNVAAKVGGVLLPVFSLVLTGIEKLIGFIETSVVPAFQKFAPSADQVKAALEKIAAAASTPWAQALAVGIGTVVTAMVVWGAATKALAVVQLAFNAVVAANPIGLIVLAILGLVAAIVYAYTHFEGFRNFVNAVWGAIKGGAEAAWNGIKTAVSAVIGVLGSTFSAYGAAVAAIWNGIKTAADAAWTFIKTAVTAVIAVLTSTVTVYRAAVIQVWNAIKTAGEAVWNAIKTVINVVILGITVYINTYRAVVVAVWNAIRSAGEAVWNAIRAAISAAITFGSNVITNFRATVAGVWGAIRDAASAAWNRVAAVIFEKMQAAKEKVESVIDRIKGLFSASALFDAGRQLIQGLINGIQSAIGGAVDAVQGGLSRIKSLLPGSPIQAGPLRSWNNGGAGKRLMDLLIFGIRSRAPAFNAALNGVTGLLGDPGSLSAGAVLATAGTAPAAGGTLTVNVGGSGSDADAGRQIVQQIAAWTALNGPVRIALAS